MSYLPTNIYKLVPSKKSGLYDGLITAKRLRYPQGCQSNYEIKLLVPSK